MRLDRLRRLIVVTTFPTAIGCGHDEPIADIAGQRAESCRVPELERPKSFVECSTGSGSFGRWTLDSGGRVAYDYALDENADGRASYPVTEHDSEGNSLDLRTHWAAFGNRRLNAMLVNDGYVEVATQDRGVELLNVFDGDQDSFSGGFGWIDDGGATWPTAYAWRPEGARTERRFGMGWAETRIEHRELRVTRTLASPPGYAPVVIDDVTIENRSDSARTIAHYEYWDVGRRPIEINWIVSGKAITAAPESARQLRDARNAMFDESVRYAPEARRLELVRSYVGTDPRPSLEQPSATDYYPVEPFLAQLVGDPTDVYVDQASFFGDGGIAAPAAVVARAPGAGTEGGTLSTRNGAGQPHLFVMKSDLFLAPGERRTLRYAYGTVRSGEDFSLSPEWSAASFSARDAYADDLADKLFYFASEEHPFLQRELAWHAYQMQTSVGWRDYWQGPVVPQGSAYLYLHGADGAARDLGLFTLPLVYTDPELARAELRLYMGIQYAADERFSYAFQGHGMLDDAGIHSAPSDLGLFFAWALGEYLGATGDFGLLDEIAPYYPREARPDATVWSHLVGALRHLFDVIGTGEHGLIRIQTGDWSDGIVPKFNPITELAIAKGESIPNTQMAVAVLPTIAELVEARDAALADEIRAKVAGYRDALSQTWTGEFFVRAYFGDGKPVHADFIDLESQVWALIGDTFEQPSEREILVSKIAKELDDPSPIGAALTPGGEVWPAISGLLSWGYAKSDPDRAWAHLGRNTMAQHALAFPDVWYGIWSGPDGVSSTTGLAWASEVTPMTDFPVQNNNQHALPLLAALRVAGIEATAKGLRITPHIPTRRFSLATRLIDLAERDTPNGSKLRGSYRPTGASARSIRIEARAGERIVFAAVDGGPATIAPNASSVELSSSSNSLSFEVEFSR